jgi:hypothetical protein
MIAPARTGIARFIRRNPRDTSARCEAAEIADAASKDLAFSVIQQTQ